MIDQYLLSILACPETKKNLTLADNDFIAKVNKSIKNGQLMSRLKEKVNDQIDGGLFREGDMKYLYPIRGGIPIVLIEELIDVSTIQ